MKAVYVLTCIMVCEVHASGDSVSGVLGDVMKEQLSIIRQCMSRRCTGKGHLRFGNIAFHAYPSKPKSNIPAHFKVVFDVASENIGKAYNPKTGIFTAPLDGVYVFHWTTFVYPGKYFATYLKVNGENKAYNYGNARSNKDWYSPSHLFVGYLKKGDKVWLTTNDAKGQSMVSGIHSSFSGFLL